MLFLIFILLLLNYVQSQTIKTMQYNGKTLRYYASADVIAIDNKLLACRMDWNDATGGYASFPNVRFSSVVSGTIFSCTRTAYPILYRLNPDLATFLTQNYYSDGTYNKVTAVLFDRAVPYHQTSGGYAYVKRPDLCDGIGWALMDFYTYYPSGSYFGPGTTGVNPSWFFDTNTLTFYPPNGKIFCQYDSTYYYSIENALIALPSLVPGSTFLTKPELMTPLSVCSDRCILDPDRQCNERSTRQCECKRPYLPIYDPSAGLISCVKPTDWTTSGSNGGWNNNNPSYIQTGNNRGACITSYSNPKLGWCREWVSDLTLTSDYCNYHGWSLIMFPFVNGILQSNYDCWCDIGWTGPRCNIPCYRSRPEEPCRTTPNDCEQIGWRQIPGYSQYCEPTDPRIRLMSMKYFYMRTATYIRPDPFPQYYPTVQGTFNGITVFEGTNTINPSAYVDPQCWVNTQIREVSYPNSFLTVCTESAMDPNTRLISTISKPRQMTINYISPSTFACSTKPGYPWSSQPAWNVCYYPLQYNPCVWGLNPGRDALQECPSSAITNPIENPTIPFNLISDQYGRISNYYVYMPAFTNVPQKIAQCKDQTKYPDPANGQTCIRCSPPCESGEYCNVGNTCSCKPNYQRVTGYIGCLPTMCPNGFAGKRCEISCQVCQSSDLTCNDGPDGDGSCICVDRTKAYNTQLKQCVSQSCQTPPTVCSGNGQCISTVNYEYCMCDPGFTGSKCQTPRFTTLTSSQFAALSVSAAAQYESGFDECDCFIKWFPPRAITKNNPIPNGWEMVADYNQQYAPMLNPILGATGQVQVGSADQAKFLCYQDAACIGFVLWRDLTYWYKIQQTNPGIDVYQAWFFTYTGLNVQSSVVLPTGISALLYQVDRYSLYPCPTFSLDTAFYSLKYRLQITSYCTQIVNSFNAARDPRTLPLSTAISCYSNAMYVKHWRYVGHLARFTPNSQCSLTPSIYEPKQYCAASRCPNGEGVPCSGNGYCSMITPSQYQCTCKTFNIASDIGTFGLNGKIAWIGNSCQFSVASSCVSYGSSSLCSGNSDRCQPKLAYSGDFYLGNFESSRVQDYVPYCNCDGTSFTGQFCEISKCSVQSLGCKGVSAAGGDCVAQNDGSYKCVCQRGAIGKYCEIDASSCLFNDLKCSSQGTCVPADLTHSDPYCVCDTGFSGQWCQNSLCPSSVMVAGHGICINQQISKCYPPYSGNRCEVDNCKLYNGTVTVDADNIPMGCNCLSNGWSNSFNNQTVPTCWPQCPIYNGSMCGYSDREPHSCLQSENVLTSKRTAQCQCAQGYILVPHPTQPGVQICEKYCKHGDVPSDWTPLSLAPCDCDISTGFDVYDNHPRCDHSVCANGGSYQVETSQCNCPRPWTSLDRCSSHSCGKNGQPVQWLNITEATSPYKCQCQAPYAPLYSQSPFDCSGTICGLNGILNPFYLSVTNPALWCLCQGKYKTDCTSPDGCQYCTVSSCLNGGIPLTFNRQFCNCPFPYQNGPKGICENNLCNSQNTELVMPGQCVCKLGYKGERCSDAICLNNGVLDPNSLQCRCPAGYYGIYCEVYYTDVLDYLKNTTMLWWYNQKPVIDMSSTASASNSSLTGSQSPSPTTSSNANVIKSFYSISILCFSMILFYLT